MDATSPTTNPLTPRSRPNLQKVTPSLPVVDPNKTDPICTGTDAELDRDPLHKGIFISVLCA
jgi:hypothetical protein